MLPGYFAVLTIILMMGLVITRVLLLRRRGIAAMHFGKLDRTDFLIPPFALFYFYLVFASAFGWPTVSRQQFFDSDVISWVGVLFCVASVSLLLWSLISFGRSFRVGIDTENPDKLITSGVFAYSRNPIYAAFGMILLGQFLIFSNWILLLYLVAGVWLFHRQVLREEEYLKKHYGSDYLEYCSRVRRYL
jgi:protein-S-isoprenylcysteine O-methyltransferase Ste14